MNLAAIPSPSTAVWHVLGLPIRAYALCIVLGIVVACLVTEARLRRRGVAPWAVLDMAVWAVPFGIVGARLYHVITSPQAYFGDGGTPIRAFYIWEGGLGIWGGVAGGALGAWFAARQLGLPLSVFADALAPGLPLAQAIGRFGNWFNNELYGSVTTLPWGLRVHDMDRENPGRATVIDGQPVVLPDLYHPTFLYEALWDVGVAILVLLLDRRFKFGRGRAFALYVMAYTVGRFWIEMLRTDDANTFFGVRLNVFTAVLVFLGALIYFVRVRGPREYVVPVDAPDSVLPDAAPNDLSQFDASMGGERSASAPPPAYQVVSEERFEAYRRTGVLPPAYPAPGTGVSGLDLPSSDVPEPVGGGGSVVLTRPATTESAMDSSRTEPQPMRSDFAKPQPAVQEPVAAPPTAATTVEQAATAASAPEVNAAAEPVATEPVATESVATEPESVRQAEPEGGAVDGGAAMSPTTTPDAAEPEATKPSATDPAATGSVPAKSAPAKSAPAKAAPAKAAPAKAAPAKAAPAKAAPAKAVRAKSTPAKSTPAKSARAKSAPAKSAPTKSAPAGTAPAGPAPAGESAPAGAEPSDGPASTADPATASDER